MPTVADIIGAAIIGKTDAEEKEYRTKGKKVSPTHPAIRSIPIQTPFWSMNRARGTSLKSGNLLPTSKPTNPHSKRPEKSATDNAVKDKGCR